MRICRRCNIEKDLNAFKTHTHGHRHVCKKCQYEAEMSNPESYKNRILRLSRYRNSEHGRVKEKQYAQSPKGKAVRRAAIDRYQSTAKGHLSKYNSTAKRRAARIQRTANWLSEDDLWIIKEIYALAAARTKLHGFTWHVDHIIPLQGKLVSGLHIPGNLQVIPWIDNIKKHNRVEL